MCAPTIGRELRFLLLGQVISALIAGTGIFSTFLAEAGLDVPTFQSLLNYLLLSLYAVVRLYSEGWSKPLRVRRWQYALLALADVEANALIVSAYQHTSLTSIMLLDCATIPTCMLLSYRFLGAQFTRRHILGVGIAVLGVACLAWSDYARDDGVYPNAVWGDVLCLGAATLYAISNVGQEACLKAGRGSRVEYLAALGLLGSCISAVQVLIFEREAVRSANWSPQNTSYILGFALCLFTMYTLTSFFLAGEVVDVVSVDAPAGLRHQDALADASVEGSCSSVDNLPCVTTPDASASTVAGPASHPMSAGPSTAERHGRMTTRAPAEDSYSTLFNLSLLTSDMWAILASTLLFKKAVEPLYYVALLLVVVGMGAYHAASRPKLAGG